jgi:TM2 domain-containing membrane protein YozV
MFNLDTAFATELLVLAAGAALLGWSGYAQVHAKKLVKAIAYAVIVLSVLSMLCTAYYGLKYTRMGYFKTPAGMMHHQGKMHEEMMKDGMKMQGDGQAE